MPNTYEVHVKDSARRYPTKVTRVCWVWWDRAAKRYRGTVRDVPVQERWDRYRIWQDAHVVSEVEAATIPELVELLRRYAEISADIQQKLLRDTPPGLRRSSDVAGAAATTELS